MTPFAVASRIAHLCNAAASGDPGARAELGRALPAIEFFNEEIREVFAGALEPCTSRYLIDVHGAAVATMNPRLADLLTERCAS